MSLSQQSWKSFVSVTFMKSSGRDMNFAGSLKETADEGTIFGMAVLQDFLSLEAASSRHGGRVETYARLVNQRKYKVSSDGGYQIHDVAISKFGDLLYSSELEK
ncbi:unnamed protein product [Brassica oleracea]|uniref:(rape) hypothetical protein n=1 Tax=Brassica napus TaxID=3708 RepID=A0A816K4L7_BRANA|nr:unnamed protein product [Brassica napus]